MIRLSCRNVVRLSREGVQIAGVNKAIRSCLQFNLCLFPRVFSM